MEKRALLSQDNEIFICDVKIILFFLNIASTEIFGFHNNSQQLID